MPFRSSRSRLVRVDLRRSLAIQAVLELFDRDGLRLRDAMVIRLLVDGLLDRVRDVGDGLLDDLCERNSLATYFKGNIPD